MRPDIGGQIAEMVPRANGAYYCHSERARRSVATERESKDPFSLNRCSADSRCSSRKLGRLSSLGQHRNSRTTHAITELVASHGLCAASKLDQPGARSSKLVARSFSPLTSDHGSALLEFAISLPLLVVFLVGIFDFSGAFNQKQKIEHAAQEGAILAAAQPMSDIETSNANPDSLQPVVTAIFNSLSGSNALPLANQGTCKAPAPGTLVSGVKWSYTIDGCPDTLTITIDRGWVPGGTVTSVGTSVQVSYPYRWRFNSVIQLLIPNANYAARTDLTETATAQNQM